MKDKINQLTEKVIGCAIEVHKTLGPGLLESAYQQCLSYEFSRTKLLFEMEKAIPVIYKGVNIDCGFRCDLIIENKLIVELKAVEKILPIHEAQILTYLKLTQIKIGLLINFNEKLLKNGIKRFIL